MVTLVLFALAAAWTVDAAGAGHGSYLPALGLFPIPTVTMGLISMVSHGRDDILEWLIPALAFLQFALYGYVIGRAWIKGKVRKAAIILGSAHGAVLLALAIYFAITQATR